MLTKNPDSSFTLTLKNQTKYEFAADGKLMDIHEPAGNQMTLSYDHGRLVTVLDDRILSGSGIFAVYPHRRYLPAKVRVFVDFLVQWFRTRDGA